MLELLNVQFQLLGGIHHFFDTRTCLLYEEWSCYVELGIFVGSLKNHRLFCVVFLFKLCGPCIVSQITTVNPYSISTWWFATRVNWRHYVLLPTKFYENHCAFKQFSVPILFLKLPLICPVFSLYTLLMFFSHYHTAIGKFASASPQFMLL
jgi:hypothetical protein